MKESTIQDLTSLDASVQIDLVRIYYDYENEPTSYYPFTSNSNGWNTPIIFQGVTYNPLPCSIDEIFTDTQGKLSRPRLTISNNGLVISKILRQKNDFKNGRVSRIRTQLRSLDDVNFDGGENPFGPADPSNVISNETFVINQKLAENAISVQFELTSPLDLDEFTVPGRLVLPRYCSFAYRGCGCQYNGFPVEQGDGTPFPVAPNLTNFSYATYSNEWQYDKHYPAGSVVFLETTRNPRRTFYVANLDHTSNDLNQPATNPLVWSKDGCQKTISACRKRFLNTTIAYSDTTVQNPITIGKSTSSLYLPFGGFPSVDSYAYGSPR